MNKIEQITLFDERYYQVEEKYLPSITWVLNSYPKNIAFQQWLANNGWEEAERIKDEAADRGSKVHNAIEDMLNGAELTYKTPYFSKRMQEHVPLSDSEWNHLMTFKAWWDMEQPRLVTTEKVVYSLKYNYAGTTDAILSLKGGTLTVADWKTSSGIFPTYYMQIAAYIRAIEEMVPDLKGKITRGLIVRTGTRHKVGYEVGVINEEDIEKYFQQFLCVKNVWAIEHGSKSPVDRQIAKTLSINVEKEEVAL